MTSGPPDKRKALGKGLSALLPARPAATVPVVAPETGVQRIPVSMIDPNPLQPRLIFEPTKIEELAQSIRTNGLIQPLIVRHRDNRYELIAGERRLRAAKLAGLETVPVVIQDYAPDRILEIALIENIQREDLNPIELALAYDRLNRELGLTHEQIGERTGKDRSSVANTIRLLRLPKEVRQMVSDHKLSMGQARALLSLEAPEAMLRFAEKAVAQGLTTRQVEAMVRQSLEPGREKPERIENKQDPNIRAAAEQLERILGTRVRIVESSEQRGKIEIDYFSQEELVRLHEQIAGK